MSLGWSIPTIEDYLSVVVPYVLLASLILALVARFIVHKLRHSSLQNLHSTNALSTGLTVIPFMLLSIFLSGGISSMVFPYVLILLIVGFIVFAVLEGFELTKNWYTVNRWMFLVAVIVLCVFLWPRKDIYTVETQFETPEKTQRIKSVNTECSCFGFRLNLSSSPIDPAPVRRGKYCHGVPYSCKSEETVYDSDLYIQL